MIQDIVTGSGNRAFSSRNLPVPDWWPTAAASMANEIELKLAEKLEQHDLQKEKEQKTWRKRAGRTGLAILSLIVGAILGWLLGWFFPSR